MSSRIEILTAGDADDEEVNEFLREAETDWYEDAAFFGAMAHRPELLKRFVSAFRAFAESERIDDSTLELMRLRVAEAHECAYCATVRTEDVRENVAPKEAAVFGDEIDTERLTDREALAVQLADALSADPHGITDAFVDELKAEFSDAELVELLLFASLEVGLDRFTIALTLDTAEESAYPSGLTYPFDRKPTGDE